MFKTGTSKLDHQAPMELKLLLSINFNFIDKYEHF
jgi:hypothetical protein